MGSLISSSYTLTADEESLFYPDQLSVRTSELNFEPEDVIEALADIMRQPVPPEGQHLVKECQVIQHGDCSYTVKAVMDGVKLDQLGIGSSRGVDRVLNWTKVTWDLEELTFTMESYLESELGAWMTSLSPEPEMVYKKACCQLSKDPTLLEFWWEGKKGIRLHGSEQAANLRLFLDPVLAVLEGRKVRCRGDQESIATPGQLSVISDPLDSFITFDALFNYLTNWKLEFVDAEITEMSSTDIFVTGKGGLETHLGTLNVHFDRETGEIERVHKALDVFQDSSHLFIHRNPLRLEVWKVDMDGHRNGSKSMALGVESILNKAITEASSWF